MKALKVAGLALLGYVGLVVLFESMLGLFQPRGGETVVLTTLDEDGVPHARVVSRLVTDGSLHVAANHWPRAWYRRVLERPEVVVEVDGIEGRYVAVPVTGAEHEQVRADHPVGLAFRVLTGFPPRYFVRLDPR